MNQFKKVIEDRGISVVPFAKQLGISKSAMYNYISGDRRPNICEEIKISNALGIDRHELFEGYGDNMAHYFYSTK